MALNWRGPQVQKRVESASELAVDATMQAASIDAKKGHRGPSAARNTEGITGKVSVRRFKTRTGELERSIRITQKAKRDSKGVFGRWGSKGVIYARRIELGFQGPNVDAPAFPFLRPAANVEYGNLASRIRRALGRGRLA